MSIKFTALVKPGHIPEENAAALEPVSRFAVAPCRLIYLPPTMPPAETAAPGQPLDPPDQASQHYRARE